MGDVEVRWLDPGDVDALVEASDLFDGPVDAVGAERFLGRPGHHLALASVEGIPVGFVSGVVIDHPDKGPELLLYELGVDEELRRQGIGAELASAIEARSIELGCRGTWVLTEPDNEAAIATYRRAGASDPEPSVVLEWPREG